MATPTNTTQAITNLQRYLRVLSKDELGANKVPIDGIFGSATRQALTNFQRREGLSQTGIADKATWDTLFSRYMEATDRERNKKGLFLFPDTPSDYAVSLGDAWMLVNVIQLLLMELRVTYDIFENVIESGVYDSETEAAIKEFQRINLLPETGRVDAATYDRIVREYSLLSKSDR